MKECFIIMPISDQPGYPSGQFQAVYNEIIVPACKIMKLEPYLATMGRGSDIIIFDILKRLIQSPIAICDLSSKNPNVMFELGIRQAFDLPVVLLKDDKTDRVFDIESIRYCNYDSKLWPEFIQSGIDNLVDHLSHSLKSESEFTLVKMLGIKAAEVKPTKISSETRLLLDAIERSQHSKEHISNRYISDFEVLFENNVYCMGGRMSIEDFQALKIGQLIHLGKSGFGEIVKLNDTAKNDFSFTARSLLTGNVTDYVFLPGLFNSAIFMK